MRLLNDRTHGHARLTDDGHVSKWPTAKSADRASPVLRRRLLGMV